MIQQQPSKIILDFATFSTSKTEKTLPVTISDKFLPFDNIIVRSRVESRRIRNTNIKIIPGISLDQKASNVSHTWLVNATRTPFLVLGPSKIPGYPSHRQEMIPSIISCKIRLVLNPLEHHLAVKITFFSG
jgi:hypothetical protein